MADTAYQPSEGFDEAGLGKRARTLGQALRDGFRAAMGAEVLRRPLDELAAFLVEVRGSITRTIDVPGRVKPVTVHDWDGRSKPAKNVYAEAVKPLMEGLTEKQVATLVESLQYAVREAVKGVAPKAELHAMGLSSKTKAEKAKDAREKAKAKGNATDAVGSSAEDTKAAVKSLGLADRAAIVVAALESLGEYLEQTDAKAIMATGETARALTLLKQAEELAVKHSLRISEVRVGAKTNAKAEDKPATRTKTTRTKTTRTKATKAA